MVEHAVEHEGRVAVEAVLDELTAVRKRGRPGCKKVRFLFGHPPPFEAPDAWDKATLLTWAKDTADWLETRVRDASDGHAVVERADLHLDETRPHLHISIIPAMPKRPRDRDEPWSVYRADPGPSRLSWTALQRSLSPAESSRMSMRGLQTAYQDGVGRHFGMIRGELKSQSRADPDRLAGLVTRVKLTAAKADRERRRSGVMPTAGVWRRRSSGRAGCDRRPVGCSVPPRPSRRDQAMSDARGDHEDGAAAGEFRKGDDTAARKLAETAVFDENEVLRGAVVDQHCRCAGCGLPLELGAAVLTTVRFAAGRALIAVHSECREGLRTLVTWEALDAVLQVNAPADTDAHHATGTATALLRASRRWLDAAPAEK